MGIPLVKDAFHSGRHQKVDIEAEKVVAGDGIGTFEADNAAGVPVVVEQPIDVQTAGGVHAAVLVAHGDNRHSAFGEEPTGVGSHLAESLDCSSAVTRFDAAMMQRGERDVHDAARRG